MRRLLVHLATVGVGVTEHVASELDDHHLHAEADAEGGDVVCAAVVGCHNLSLDATLSESRADEDAVLTLELLCHVVLCEVFGIDEGDVHLAVVVCSGVRETLTY